MSLTPCAKGWSGSCVSYTFVCFTLSGNLVRFLCVFYTDFQVLVCVLVVLTPSDNFWSVLLCFLHRMPRVDLCSNISYTMYHGLSVFVRLITDLDTRGLSVFVCVIN